MSARAWQRRRRYKYLRKYMKQLKRYPDRIIMLPTGQMLMSIDKYNELIGWLDEVEQLNAQLTEIEAASNQPA